MKELHQMRVRDWPELKQFKPHQRCEGTRWLSAFGRDRMAHSAWDECEVPGWMQSALWKIDYQMWHEMMDRLRGEDINWGLSGGRDIKACDLIRERFGNPFRKNGIKEAR